VAGIDIDREKLRQKIALIGEKINSEADPHLLNEYRSLFKKGFSFFRRPWAAAYLLMLYDQGNLGRAPARPRTKGPFSGEGGRPGAKWDGASQEAPWTGPSGPRPFLAEDESRRLFISIGRNRHVFPREILGLIITRAQVAREDIGVIRILDSYSFVQVRDTVADTIIEALNGTVFRGRTITANYARLKREDGTGETRGQDIQESDTQDTQEPDTLDQDTQDTQGEGLGEDSPEPYEPLEQGDDQGDEEGV
jgi:hypothetical protein